MPRGNYSGPRGLGPKTGRGMGYCAGNNAPGFLSSGSSLGFGWHRGFGRGMGWGRAFGWPMQGNMDAEEDIAQLKQQAGILKRQQEDIAKRIKELEKKE